MNKNMGNYTVLGIGGCIVDNIIRVSDDFLSTIPGKKGGMELVTHNEILEIIGRSKKKPYLTAGGSATNTIKGLSHLGIQCAMAGKVGRDGEGKCYMKRLQSARVAPLLFHSATPSAIVLCLITPDGQRTMRTFLGASSEFDGNELFPEMFEDVRLVHIEGYTLDHKNLTERALNLAKEAGALVSLDLSSFEIVRRYKKRITSIISTSVDILFSNSDEAREITGAETTEAACTTLGMICNTAIVLMGKDGCCISHKGIVYRFPAIPVESPLDTTGAGDLFASGFLYGTLTGENLATCAHYGAIVGNAVVQTIGAELNSATWGRIKHAMKQKTL